MRFLHTMLRVKDLDASIHFWTEHFGMKLLRKHDFPGGKFTLTFVGYGDESEHTVIELTHNWDQDDYVLGDQFGHIAIGVDDIFATCKKLEAAGVSIPRPPGAMKHGSTVIAFVEDPNGYKVELIQQK
jgi:lactoylglutathione lyase